MKDIKNEKICNFELVTTSFQDFVGYALEEGLSEYDC